MRVNRAKKGWLEMLDYILNKMAAHACCSAYITQLLPWVFLLCVCTSTYTQCNNSTRKDTRGLRNYQAQVLFSYIQTVSGDVLCYCHPVRQGGDQDAIWRSPSSRTLAYASAAARHYFDLTSTLAGRRNKPTITSTSNSTPCARASDASMQLLCARLPLVDPV